MSLEQVTEFVDDDWFSFQVHRLAAVGTGPFLSPPPLVARQAEQVAAIGGQRARSPLHADGALELFSQLTAVILDPAQLLLP